MAAPWPAPPPGTNRSSIPTPIPLGSIDFAAKTKLLAEIDAYARAKDPRVRQVSASLAGCGRRCRSSAPTAAASPTSGRWCASMSASSSARATAWRPAPRAPAAASTIERYLDPAHWQAQVDEALRQALVNLGSVPAPAGEMTVVLGPGWPGVMLHEAVGHGLEGDFNRKKTSAFAGLIGQRVAAGRHRGR